MHAALPWFRALIALMPLASVGCGTPQPATPVGVSTAMPDIEGAPKPAPPPPRVAWSEFEAARAWPEAAPPTRALAHRRDGTLIHVRVEPAALDPYRALAEEAPMPNGARVMAWHESPQGQLLGGYLLEKAAGVWRGREIDGRGAVVPGDGAACVRCHDMAPTDHLFGLAAATPLAAPPPTSRESAPVPAR